jgi:SAM-dependent methyltransferase
MGLDINGLLFLLTARKRGVNFGDVLMVGRLELNVYPAKIRQVLAKAGLPNELFDANVRDTGFAEPAFKALGARSVHSIDASAYEEADFVRDLNKPIDTNLKERFDLVYDGGTLEHIFNFPMALQNCMEMVREGGRFFMHTAANNWCGHGFYQFSPELFYTVLCHDNGFEVERMIIHVVGPYSRWYEVADPRAIRSRVELITSYPMQLLIQARRTKVVPIFSKTPQQSDYLLRWGQQSPIPPTTAVPSRPALARILPGFARLVHVVKTGWQFWHNQSLGNRKFFRPVKRFPIS